VTARRKDTAARLRTVVEELDTQFIGRREHIVATVVGLLAGAHSYWMGERGTGKTSLAHAVCSRVTDARFFDFTFDRQMSKDDVFGPTDMRRVNEENLWVRNTGNHLPGAHLALGDELDEGSTSTLNALRAPLLNRQFFNGDLGMQEMPLISFIAASNSSLDTTRFNLGALQDRFLLHLVFEPLSAPEELLQLMSAVPDAKPVTTITLRDLLAAQSAAAAVKIPVEVVEDVVALYQDLTDAGVPVSNRRLRECQSLIRALAWLRGRDQAEKLDLEVLRHCFWTDPQHRDVVHQKTLDAAGLTALAEAMSLVQSCRRRLSEHGGSTQDRSRLGLTVLRELDELRSSFQWESHCQPLTVGLTHEVLRACLDEVTVMALRATGYDEDSARERASR
jgi:MoxR-like ATPase